MAEIKNYLSLRQKLNIIEGEMRDERVSFEPFWRDLSDYILPRRSRFFITDVNKGDRRNQKIINPAATMSARTLSSGMMTGVTSPARSWFKLRVDVAELNDEGGVKSYFTEVEKRMRDGFAKTNLYNQLPTLYGDLGTYSTGCLFMEEDMDTIANFYCFPVGSYMIANDKRGKVSVFFREFQMSVRQIVDKFGRIGPDKSKIVWDNISENVKNFFENGQLETRIDISHFILPNQDFDPKRLASKFKKYISLYYESGSSARNRITDTFNEDKFLSQRGYDYFPVMAVRWEVVGEDTYGTSAPGMVAIGDVKQLQQHEIRAAEAIDHKVRPPMVGSTRLKHSGASTIPGDITYIDERDGTQGIRRLFELDFDIRELEGKTQQLIDRISRTYYEDLFLMLAQSDRRQITATEIAERQEEKLLALGPVLERINQDLLDPLIENMFLIMDRQGLLPEPPEELLDRDYTIEYISVMAQAQKLAGIGNIERFVGFVGQAAQMNPEAIAKVNIDNIIEDYADKVGVDPSLLKSKEEMEMFREEQAAAAQAEQEAMQMEQMSKAGKNLSDTKMDEDTALAQIIEGDEIE